MKPLRQRPAWQIVAAMKARKIKQRVVAERAGCRQANVSSAIRRRGPQHLQDRIWFVIEKMIAEVDTRGDEKARATSS